MKKLITIILILAMILPAAALADDYCITKHYAMHADIIDKAYKGGGFSGDSITIDLYFMSDNETVYYMEARCFSGLFLCNGMLKMRIEWFGDEAYIVDSVGNYRMIKQVDDTMMIDFGRGYQPMQLVEVIDIY